MKLIKRFFIAVIMVLSVGFFFGEQIYNHLITYKSMGVRQTYKASGGALKEYIDSNLTQITEPDINQIVETSLEITASRLNFTTGKNDIDPNKLLVSEKAHCVGYANFFTTSCNYLLTKHNLAGEWKAKTQIGQFYIFGKNIHNYLNSPFLKDH